MDQRHGPQPLPESDTIGNDSHPKTQLTKETERVVESLSDAESRHRELRSSDKPCSDSNLETLGAGVTSSVETLAVQHRSDGIYLVQCVSLYIYIYIYIYFLLIFF